MTKLGYFDAKINKPRSPNYIKSLIFIKKHRFSSLLKNKIKEVQIKKRSSLMFTENSNSFHF